MKVLSQKDLERLKTLGISIRDENGRELHSRDLRAPKKISRYNETNKKPKSNLTIGIEKIVSEFQNAIKSSNEEIIVTRETLKSIVDILQTLGTNFSDELNKNRDLMNNLMNKNHAVLQNLIKTLQNNMETEPQPVELKRWRFQIKRNAYDNDLITEIIAKEEY